MAAGNREPVWGKAAGGAVIGAGLLAGAGVAGTKNGPLARDVAGWRAGWRRGGKIGKILTMKIFESREGMVELAVKPGRLARLLARRHDRAALEEMLKGQSMRIDRAKGLELRAARQRYGTISDAVDIHRKNQSTMKTMSTKLNPGMIEFAKVDLGEDREKYLGDVGAMPAQGPKKWYPSLHVSGMAKELPLPDEGKAVITYKVKRRSSEKYDGKEQHSATIEVQTIETPEAKRKARTKAVVRRLFSMAEALEFSDRPRNGDGQFVGAETGGADPNSMAAAYGNVGAEKAARRRGLMARIKAMMGRKDEVGRMKDEAMAMGAVRSRVVELAGGYALRDGDDNVIYREPGVKAHLKRAAGRYIGGAAFLPAMATGNPVATLVGGGALIAGKLVDEARTTKNLTKTLQEPRRLRKWDKAKRGYGVVRTGTGEATLVPMAALSPGLVEFGGR
jgi:hypothetical protein